MSPRNPDSDAVAIVRRCAVAKMTEATTYDCACVGAGIVGMTAALALAELGYRVAIVDPNHEIVELPPPFDPRSYAITEACVPTRAITPNSLNLRSVDVFIIKKLNE